MNKTVNIYPRTPITTLNPPIRGIVRNIVKSTKEIRECIIARAVVEEVLSDGSTLILDFSNYNKDNNRNPIDVSADNINQTSTYSTYSGDNSRNRRRDKKKNKKNNYTNYVPPVSKDANVETSKTEDVVVDTDVTTDTKVSTKTSEEPVILSDSVDTLPIK